MRDWNDEASWQEFFDMYKSLIYSMARKARLTEAEAQDVVQETLVSVAKRIRSFRYDPAKGSFRAWLGKLTQWRIKDQYRRRMKALAEPAAPETRTGLVERIPDEKELERLANSCEQEWLNKLNETALGRSKAKVSPKDYQIFQLYVLREWPVKKVAATLKISCAHVYVAKHRVAGVFRKELAKLLREARAHL